MPKLSLEQLLWYEQELQKILDKLSSYEVDLQPREDFEELKILIKRIKQLKIWVGELHANIKHP